MLIDSIRQDEGAPWLTRSLVDLARFQLCLRAAPRPRRPPTQPLPRRNGAEWQVVVTQHREKEPCASMELQDLEPPPAVFRPPQAQLGDVVQEEFPLAGHLGLLEDPKL